MARTKSHVKSQPNQTNQARKLDLNRSSQSASWRAKLDQCWHELSQLSWLQRAWLLAPVMMWFSYQPRIALGDNTTMNYELSLALIYVAILALIGLPNIWRGRRDLCRNKFVWLVTAFVIWSGLTVLWSANLARGVLTFGVTGLLYLILLAALVERQQLSRIKHWLANILIATAVLISLLALVQMIVGVWITNRDSLWLCAGCVAKTFGFVRPNVFAIEPQFLGNLLLAPSLILLRRLLVRDRLNAPNIICFVVVTLGLFLAMSRGAIFALGGGVLVLWAVNGRRWRRGFSMGLLIVTGGLALATQGALAAINPHLDETFGGAVAKSINQMSLGVIKLPWLKNESVATGNSVTSELSNHDNRSSQTIQLNQSANFPASSAESDKSTTYDGYVAESTDVRVGLSKLALMAWQHSGPWRMMTGSGLGSAGIAMARYSGSSYEKEIVQNEFVEVLLERGAIGLALLLAILGYLAYLMVRRHQAWTLAIILAYLIQWCFFSGLPNALHNYLVATVLVSSVILPLQNTDFSSKEKL